MLVEKNLQKYLVLSHGEKLETYLDEAQANLLETDFIDDPLVDIRTLKNAGCLIFDENIPNYMIRKALGEKIIQVAVILKSLNLGLKIYELYRSLTKQTLEFNQVKTDFIKKYPELIEKQIWEKVTEFIADPALRPPHVTGGAVDLCLVDEHGLELDMGTPMNSIDLKSYLTCKDISLEALTNRSLLLKLMLSVNLAPLPSEWWHYSFGENYWAAFYNEKVLYDTIDLKA